MYESHSIYVHIRFYVIYCLPLVPFGCVVLDTGFVTVYRLTSPTVIVSATIVVDRSGVVSDSVAV